MNYDQFRHQNLQNSTTPAITDMPIAEPQTSPPAITPGPDMTITERFTEANRRLAQIEDDLAWGRDVRELVAGLKKLLTL
jgi:hypothetical protein